MRRTGLALVIGLAVACTGVDARQADEINARLARIESQLDALGAWARATDVTLLESASHRDSGDRARIIAELGELKAKGFTADYVPVRQLTAELDRLNAQAAGVGGDRSSIIAAMERLKAQGFTDDYAPMRQLEQELARLNAASR